jgi:hypothetical protein
MSAGKPRRRNQGPCEVRRCIACFPSLCLFSRMDDAAVRCSWRGSCCGPSLPGEDAHELSQRRKHAARSQRQLWRGGHTIVNVLGGQDAGKTMARRWRDAGETLTEEVNCGAPGWPLSKNVLKMLFMRLGRHAGVSRLHLHLTSSATPTLAATCLPIATRLRIARMIRLGHTTPAMTNRYIYIRCILSLHRCAPASTGAVVRTDVRFGSLGRNGTWGVIPPLARLL